MSGYDPQHVLHTVDQHTLAVMAPMAVCMVATFAYLILAFRTAKAHRSYPAPFIAVGFFAVHDASYVLDWDRWFDHYGHWFPELWAVALIGTTFIELALVYQVFKYGREELMPRLSQREFGLAIVGGLVVIAVLWGVIKGLLNDDLYLVSFAVTAWMGPAFSIVLATGRRSRRGQTMAMAWSLVPVCAGMFASWAVLDPYFREDWFLAFFAVAIGTALFNIWNLAKYPAYDPPEVEAASALSQALRQGA